MFEVTREPVDAAALRASVSHAGAGAVVVFHGTVRDATKGRRVRFLEYEAYPAMARAMLEEVGRRVGERHGLLAVACVHRIGRLEIGDDAVVLAVSAPHRAAALAAVEEFVVAMKRDVPIWKKEHFEDGSVWVGSAGGEDAEARRAGATA